MLLELTTALWLVAGQVPPPVETTVVPVEAPEPTTAEAEEDTAQTADPAELGEESEPGVAAGYPGVVGTFQALDGTMRPLSDGNLTAVLYQGTLSPQDGFSPVRVKLQNNTNKAFPVLMEMTSNSDSATVTRRVELSPGEKRTVLLPLPTAVRYGSIKISSPALKKPVTDYVQAAPDKTAELLLVGSSTQATAFLGETPDKDNYGATVGTMTLPGAELWGEYAGYVGFEAVIVSESFADLPRDARRALEAYAATGGTLVLAKRERGLENHLPLLDGETYGLGRVIFCAQRSQCLHVALATGTQEGVVRPVQGSVYSGIASLIAQPSAPLGPFMLMMIVFALAVGPGSVWIARNRGALLLLFFIPALSLVTVMLLVGYSVIADGFGVHAAIHGVTYLDQKNHRALSAAVGGFYANVAPDGPKLGTFEAAISEPFQYQGGGASVDWTDGTAYDGFLKTRTYQEWGLRSVVETRARLSLSESGGAVKVQNALGAPIKSAWLKRDGAFYQVESVPDGAEKTATQATRSPDLTSTWEQLGTDRFSEELLKPLRNSLDDGEFVAVLEKTGPWLKFGELKLNEEPGLHIVRGEVSQ